MICPPGSDELMTDLDYIEQSLFLADPRERIARFRHDPRLRLALPEVYALDGVPQPPDYHPEGDALTHTLLAVAEVPVDADPRLAWAALLHDVGKAVATREVRGRIRAFGHDRAGEEIATKILRRLGMAETPREDILWLIRHHMFALSWQVDDPDRLSRRQWRRIADPRFPLLLELLEIDAFAAGARPDKLAQVDFYREVLDRLAQD
jgi:poly(A) polymerase